MILEGTQRLVQVVDTACCEARVGLAGHLLEELGVLSHISVELETASG
jgi:hypothetical protein